MSTQATTTSQLDLLVVRGAVLDELSRGPAHFGDPVAELAAFSDSSALLYLSSASTLVQQGADALDLLHRLSTNELLDMEPGSVRFTVLTSERGRVIDVLQVVRVADDRLMLLTASATPQASIDWIDKFTILEDSTVTDVTGDMVRLALIGPESARIANAAFGTDLVAGTAQSIAGDAGEKVIAASRWTDADRVDVVLPATELEQTWDALAESGATPSGDTAFEATRVKRGVPVSGVEISEQANPLELGLKDLVDFAKGCYVGQEVIARLDTYDKLQKRLVAFRCSGPVEPSTPLTSNGKRAGEITSISPISGDDGSAHALGFARRGYWDAGTVLEFDGGTVTVEALKDASPFG